VSTPFLEVEDLETHFPVETRLIFKRRLSAVPTVDPRRERKAVVPPLVDWVENISRRASAFRK
jgi:hypothetical protein